MSSLSFIVKVLPWIFIGLGILGFGATIFIKNRLENTPVLPIGLCIILLVVVLDLILIPFLRKRSIEKQYKSFDLSELMRDEFIIQTIDFNKFIVYGTEENGGTILDDLFFKYKDELKVYHINGRAEVIFNEINKLKTVEEDFDYEKGICRFAYDSPDYKNAFAVKVYIESIEVVQDFESEKFIGIDLKKPDITEATIIEENRVKLEKDFKDQLTKGINKKNVTNSDVYESFILALEKMVNNYGYSKVAIAFE